MVRMIVKEKSESYLHNEAKKLLIKWLRNAAEKSGGYDSDCSWCELRWRVNRGPPFYGIYEEYPITENGVLWDENGWDRETWPHYDWMKDHYEHIFKIADIIITHKGSILYIIEIKNKNSLTDEKIRFYKICSLFGGRILEIPAEWILKQIKEPTHIPEEFYV